MIGWNMILVYLNLTSLVLAFPKKETKRNYQNGEQSNHPQHQCDPENIKQAFINYSQNQVFTDGPRQSGRPLSADIFKWYIVGIR